MKIGKEMNAVEEALGQEKKLWRWTMLVMVKDVMGVEDMAI